MDSSIFRIRNLLVSILTLLVLYILGNLVSQYKNTGEYENAIVPDSVDKDDWFGDAVDISAESIVAAAYKSDYKSKKSGAVYIFSNDPTDGLMSEIVTGNNSVSGDQFGFSVSLTNDILAVGAVKRSSLAGEPASGAVYIFGKEHTGWIQAAYLEPPQTSRGDNFGFSVALSENTLAVGAQLTDSQFKNQGLVYIYKREGNAWFLQKTLYSPDEEEGAKFGKEVALHREWLFVGSPESNIGGSKGGLVHVFKKAGDDWVFRQRLEPPLGLGADPYFGSGIDSDGDDLVIGASTWTEEPMSGSAFVYSLVDGHWGKPQSLEIPTLNEGDMFGFRVSVDGEFIIIGAHMDDTAAPNAGAAYVFKKNEFQKSWSAQQKIFPGDGRRDDHFGIAISARFGQLVIGAERADTVGRDSGAIYLYQKMGNIYKENRSIPDGVKQ